MFCKAFQTIAICSTCLFNCKCYHRLLFKLTIFRVILMLANCRGFAYLLLGQINLTALDHKLNDGQNFSIFHISKLSTTATMLKDAQMLAGPTPQSPVSLNRSSTQ